MSDKGNVTSRIVAYIRKNIQKGAWNVGDKLPSENELCKILNVSRISVRSALQQFIALGILESIHGKGTFVISNDLSAFGSSIGEENQDIQDEATADMRYLLDFRSMIEPEICARITSGDTSELVEKLTEYLDIMRQSVGDCATFVQADMDFHMEIWKATNNPVAVSIMEDVSQKKKESYHKLNHAVGYYGGIYYHSLLLDAIKKHDVKHARSLMLEHLQRSIGDLTVEDERMKES